MCTKANLSHHFNASLHFWTELTEGAFRFTIKQVIRGFSIIVPESLKRAVWTLIELV